MSLAGYRCNTPHVLLVLEYCDLDAVGALSRELGLGPAGQLVHVMFSWVLTTIVKAVPEELIGPW